MLRSERRDRRSLVEPDKGIELLWKRGAGVVARQFGVGPVDNADESFEPWLQEALPKCLVPAEVEQETRNVRIMAQPLIERQMKFAS
jgi:hypothetical protein